MYSKNIHRLRLRGVGASGKAPKSAQESMQEAAQETAQESGPELGRFVEAAGVCGEPDRYAGKRVAKRIRGCRQLEVSTDRNQPHAAWAVAMHNVSDTGFAFWSKKRPPTHGVIYVREFSGGEVRPWLAARIVHCTAGIRGFLVGANFE